MKPSGGAGPRRALNPKIAGSIPASAAIFLMIAVGSARADDTGLSLEILAGSVASLSAPTSGVEPFARLQASGPLTTFTRGPRLDVRLDLSALPGDAITTEDPRTWRSLALAVGVRQDFRAPLLFGAYAEGGFASRMAGEDKPRVRSPKWVSAGLRFAAATRRAELRLGIGADQRTGKAWATVVHVGGQIALRESPGADVLLVVGSILGVGHGAGADVHTVAVAFRR